MTQTQQIKEHLQKGQAITPLDALMKYGCLRLAARISDLRNEGMNIRTDIVKTGKKKYAKYRLA